MNWDLAVNRNREVSYQARLNKKLEKKLALLTDNAIMNQGYPEDILLVKEVKNVNGDVVSTISSGHIVTNVTFPRLQKVPVKTVKSTGKYAITSIVSALGEGSDQGKNDKEDVTTFEVRIPISAGIEEGNKLVRVFVQEGGPEEGYVNTVMVFDVINVLADFSLNAPIAVTAVLSLSKKPIDANKTIYQKIIALAQRRLEAGY